MRSRTERHSLRPKLSHDSPTFNDALVPNGFAHHLLPLFTQISKASFGTWKGKDSRAMERRGFRVERGVASSGGEKYPPEMGSGLSKCLDSKCFARTQTHHRAKWPFLQAVTADHAKRGGPSCQANGNQNRETERVGEMATNVISFFPR